MKKIFLILAIVLAPVCRMKANLVKNIEFCGDTIIKQDSTPYVVTFYNIEQLIINNRENVLIRVYDKQWNLIEETRDSVNILLPDGEYIVASEKKIKTKYICR